MKLRFKTGDRGLEPIISALLMVVITVSAFSIAYMGTTAWIKNQKEGPLMRMQERLTVEDVWFKVDGTGKKYVCVYLRNVGKIEVILYDIMIDGIHITERTPAKLTLPLELGGWMTAVFPWTAGQTYEVKLLTDRGGEVITYAAA